MSEAAHEALCSVLDGDGAPAGGEEAAATSDTAQLHSQLQGAGLCTLVAALRMLLAVFADLRASQLWSMPAGAWLRSARS